MRLSGNARKRERAASGGSIGAALSGNARKRERAASGGSIGAALSGSSRLLAARRYVREHAEDPTALMDLVTLSPSDRDLYWCVRVPLW